MTIYFSSHDRGKIEGFISLNFLCAHPCGLKDQCYMHGVFKRNKRAYATYYRNGVDLENELASAATIENMAKYINQRQPAGFRPASVGDLNTWQCWVNMIRLCRQLECPTGIWVTPHNQKWAAQLKFYAPNTRFNYSHKEVGSVVAPRHKCMDNSFCLYRSKAQRDKMIDACAQQRLDVHICENKCEDCMVCYTQRNFVVLEKLRVQQLPDIDPAVCGKGYNSAKSKRVRIKA